MSKQHMVGMNVDGKSRHVTIEAEDALIAALRAKHDNPRAAITYVRKTNRRADKQNPDNPARKD